MRRGEFLRPLNDVPQRLVLASLGVIKGCLYGAQKLFQLAGGPALYRELEVAQKLEQAVSIGQEFWLCKRRPAGKGAKGALGHLSGRSDAPGRRKRSGTRLAAFDSGSPWREWEEQHHRIGTGS